MSEIDYKDTSYLDLAADMRVALKGKEKEEEIDKNALFIFDNKEVKLTGRRAKKKVKLESGSTKLDTIYEIKVVDGVDWTHWIRLRDLYTIEEY